MALTTSAKIYKDRGQENLRNRGQIDHARAKMANYSATDITVGASDTLEIQIATLPAGAILKTVSVTPVVANGATLVALIATTGGTKIHSATNFNLNATAGTPIYSAASVNVFAVATPIYVYFANNADVNASVLDFEVALDFHYASIKDDAAGLI